MNGIRKSVKTDAGLRSAEIANFGNPVDDIMQRVPAMASYQPWEGRDGPCGYGEEVDKIYWEDMPIDSEIIESHNNWVNNRRQWSGTSKYLQESIEPTVDWIGIKPGGIGPPEPIPQNCGRAEITEYGPADFETFITQQRRKCGNPIINPMEMAAEYRSNSFSSYGF